MHAPKAVCVLVKVNGILCFLGGRFSVSNKQMTYPAFLWVQ